MKKKPKDAQWRNIHKRKGCRCPKGSDERFCLGEEQKDAEDWDEKSWWALARIVANMTFHFNGSDITNPPMIGLSDAVETLKETYRTLLAKERARTVKEIESWLEGRTMEGTTLGWNTFVKKLLEGGNA